MSRSAVIRATGSAVPAQVLTNHDLEKFVDTNDEWIRQRTGISERRRCSKDETASTLSIEAANKALQRAHIDPASLDLVICATVTGDYPFPSTSCLIQNAIGAKNAAAFDLGAACAGFIYSTSVASSMIRTGQCKRVLVVGVDVLTKFVDWTDRSTCVLFGDGAGCIILEGSDEPDKGILHTVMLADGSGGPFISCMIGGSKYPLSDPESMNQRVGLFMAGAETYRFAVNAIGDACCRVLDETGLTPEDIDLFVPHQANIRIIQSAAERLKLPDEKVFKNIERYGNTSAGSIPLCLDEAAQSGQLKPGMLVMTVGFGAGLVWGANLIRW